MKKVLIVDYDIKMRIFISAVLEKNNYVPIVARNGEEGLAKAKEEEPDLIIHNVLMPKLSGIRMYHELKTDEQLRGIPVIILSDIAKRTFLRSLEALTELDKKNVPDPEAYIEKPVEPEELMKVIIETLA
ncbi:MAG: response regulator [Thermodesulfobacteriota bacterium]|nr:response regulator [Thermodesulfobacteriota bacterium]